MSRLNSFELIVALFFILVGVLLLAGNLGLIFFNWSMVWGLLLICFGGWFIWRAYQPSEFTTSFANTAFYGLGDYRPDLTGKEIHKESFSHGLGDFDLDLTRATIPEGTHAVRASLGLGDLTVIVPRDLAVRIGATAGLGAVKVLGQHSDGFGPRVDFRSEDYAAAMRKLDVEASVGLGEVKVVRAR